MQWPAGSYSYIYKYMYRSMYIYNQLAMQPNSWDKWARATIFKRPGLLGRPEGQNIAHRPEGTPTCRRATRYVWDIYSFTDLLSNRRLRNNNFSITLKNMHQLHFSRRKVQLHFSNRKVQLVAVVFFFKLRLHFSEWLRNNYFSDDWHIDKPIVLFLCANVRAKKIDQGKR
jgi:hypothetical protein